MPAGVDRRSDAAHSSPARTWIPCPTAAPSTGRWAWCRRSPRSIIVRARRCRAPGSRRRRRVLRRGGRPVRRRLRRLAAVHRRAERRERALGLRDDDGITLADALTKAGRKPEHLGADPTAGRPRRRLRRTARRAGPRTGSGRQAGRRRFGDLAARALAVHVLRRGQPCGHHPTGGPSRPDAGVRLLGARGARRGRRHDAVATFGKVSVTPNGANAIPSPVHAWLDARAADEATLSVAGRQDHRGRRRQHAGGRRHRTRASTPNRSRRSSRSPTGRGPGCSGRWPRLRRRSRAADRRPATTQGSCPPKVPTAMLFVRNPTGVSHSPDEYAEIADCHCGAEALADVMADWVHRDRHLVVRTRLAGRRCRGRRRVLVSVTDGRITAIETDSPRSRTRTGCAGWSFRAWPTRIRMPSTARCAPAPNATAARSGRGVS